MASKNKGYSKRPMWQWVVIYLVVGGLVYLFLYYIGVLKFSTY